MATSLSLDEQLEVARIHAQMGYDYKMPNLASPLFVALRAAKNKQGHIVGAAGLRLQAEAYLWLDPSAGVAEKLRAMLELHRELLIDALALGVDCVVAYLPPKLPRSFRFLLQKLGWSRDRSGWKSWSRQIG